MSCALAGSPKTQSRNLTLTLLPWSQVGMGRPKYLQKAAVPPEVFHLLNALELAAEAVGRSLLANAKIPAWRDELTRHVSRLTSLLLVRGESGGPSIVARVADLEERMGRLEGERKAGAR